MIEVELPDGTIAEFPDGTSSYVIKGALQKRFAKPDTGTQNVDASTVYVDEMLFGLPGKAAAGLNALVRAPFTDKTIGEEYNTIRSQYQNARQQYADENPIANAAASIGGAIQGGGVATRGIGTAANAIAPSLVSGLGSRYAGRMAGDAALGLGLGGVSAYGHDQDVGTGALIGGAVGGVARPVISLAGGALSGLGSLVGIGNASRARNAVSEAVQRSGSSADDVANELARAAAQGQPEYMVADVLGNSGQRMLTGIARSPGDMRQTIAETLTNRQTGQGDRLVNALSEGFNAPTTASQARTAMTDARTANAATNYGAARASAGTVDPTAAIRAADDFLGTAGGITRTGIADDSVEGAVRRARSLLTDDANMVSDFDTAFRAKIELDSMIQNANPIVQRQLIPIRNSLDDALSNASDQYAAARDQFRRESQNISAIDEGSSFSSGRVRASDSIPRFNAMTDEQQAAARIGYADPQIARVEAAASAPTTNKVRALLTGKTAQEYPAFAAPGQAQMLGERLAREQRMFETANQALGGSRTADNLADATEVMGFDPTILGIIGNGLSGNLRSAAMQGLQTAVNSVNGRNQATRDMIARMLLQSDPTIARAELASALQSGARLTQAQEAVIRSLIGGGATAYSRQ